MREEAVFNLLIVFDEVIDFFSLIVKPLDECQRVYNYLSNPLNSNRVMSIPFINGNLTLTFGELSSYIDVDDDPDNIRQHQVKYPYWRAIDSFVTGFIYDEVLNLIKKDRMEKREKLTDAGFELLRKTFGDD